MEYDMEQSPDDDRKKERPSSVIDIAALESYLREALAELPDILAYYKEELIGALEALRQHPPTKAEVLSIPNAISLAGFSLVVSGCQQINRWEGVSQIALGRGFDLVDGFIARKTGQTSALGAAVDATLDKAGMLLILSSAWHQGAMPKEAIAAMVGQNGLSAATTTRHKLRDPDADIRPTKTGKAGMFLQNVAALTYLVDNALERHGSSPRLQRSMHLGANVLATVGVGVGLAASWQYGHRLPPKPTFLHEDKANDGES